MRLDMVRDLFRCEVLTGADALDTEIDMAVASDAMSVVLASPHPQALMITGLTNIQSVRTAQILHLPAILYVLGGLAYGSDGQARSRQQDGSALDRVRNV